VAIAAFSGAIGLAGTLLPLSVAAFLTARGYRFATRPTTRATAMAALCYLPAWSAHAFGDIGFQSFTGGLLLAVAFASASRVSAWTGAWGAARRSEPRAGRPEHRRAA
jgi:hypothetical protein